MAYLNRKSLIWLEVLRCFYLLFFHIFFMVKDKARSITDASEVAGLMTPLIEAKILMEIDPQILNIIRMLVGEVGNFHKIRAGCSG